MNLCRAIIWALATLAPGQARPIFSRLLIQRLGTRLPISASEQALTVALPHLLDDQLVNEVRNWLLHTARDIVALPDTLVELLVKHGTKASHELLLVISTHFLVASSLSQDARLSIYQALSSHPASSIRYLLDHASERHVAPREVARALAWLLDESRLSECRDALTSSALPTWLIHLTYQTLSDTGKLGVDQAVQGLRTLGTGLPAEPSDAIKKAITYLENQRPWIGSYEDWRKPGYPVGSGMIERAAALVINRRMKKRVMRWKRANGTAIVALRTDLLNDDWMTPQRLRAFP